MNVPALPLEAGAQMPCYRFHFHFNGKVLYSAEHEFADDLEALDTARRLAREYEIEVLNGERFVARVKTGDQPLNVRDLRSGRRRN